MPPRISKTTPFFPLFLLFLLLFYFCCSPVNSIENVTSFESLISEHETALQNICESIRSFHRTWYEYDEHNPCEYYEVCDGDLNELPLLNVDGTYFANTTVYDELTFRFSDNVHPNSSPQVKEFVCLLHSTKEAMRRNLEKDPQMKWQYVASDYGAIAFYPGASWTKNTEGRMQGLHLREAALNSPSHYPQVIASTAHETCPHYDPRTYKWYIEGSSPPKNIILLLDRSGSMKENQRIDNVRKAAEIVLDSLTARDLITVIFFNEVSYTCECDSLHSGKKVMLQATEANKTCLRKCMNNIEASGESDFGKAFDTAFDILDNSIAANYSSCISAILFFTDGQQTDSQKKPIEIISQRNEKIGARVFSFVFGSPVDLHNMRTIACNAGGLSFTLREEGNLRTQMTKYYQMLAFEPQSNRARWSHIFQSVTPAFGKIVAATLPCHGDNGALLGVAGIDVPLERISSFPDWNNSLQVLQNQSDVCPGEFPTEEYVRLLRGGDCNYCDPSLCGTALHAFIGIASVGGLFVLLVVIGLVFYIIFTQLRKCKQKYQKYNRESPYSSREGTEADKDELLGSDKRNEESQQRRQSISQDESTLEQSGTGKS